MNSKRTVENTATKVAENPIIGLFLASGNGEGIYAQEAAGQRQLVHSDVLPADFNRGKREEFEALGIIFGEPVEGDPLFVYATLPEGWKKQPTDHSMWSELIDETGKVRVRIFYKAAFYDRKAHMSIA